MPFFGLLHYVNERSAQFSASTHSLASVFLHCRSSVALYRKSNAGFHSKSRKVSEGRKFNNLKDNEERRKQHSRSSMARREPRVLTLRQS
ncbi:hypothetical protein TNCV_1326491 [Trichonephila clavipes]|nr:hypothetical protein TNCV_1326491 [Trichonephila clavipes]